jgi:ComF family protein
MFASLNQTARRVFLPLLDFFYPPVCLSCNQLLPDGRQHVCDQCWNSIQRVERSLELYQETRGKLFASGAVDELVASFVFEKGGSFQHIAHALKYSGVQSLGIELGHRLGGVIIDWGLRADYVVPIPLHKRKLRERGYNQAELIARGVSVATSIPVKTGIVLRKRFTQTQTALSLEERQKNVKDAFELRVSDFSDIRDKAFILVDDVITTGATIEACGRELRQAGASCIIAASSALAQ